MAAPRSIWNGTISVGLVNVPVKVHSATESRTVSFKEVHAADGAPIEHHRFCAEEDAEVPYEEIAKGYEVRSGEYVLLSQDEIKAAAGEATKVIDVEELVDLGEIDPVFFDKNYHLGARDGGADAYRLLHAALKHCDRAAIGRWTFHNREYLVAVRARDGVLAMHTLRFADEIVDAEEIDVADPDKAPAKREVEMAAALVESLYEEFDPSRYEDTHRKAVLRIVDQKAKGQEIEVEPEEDDGPSDDLMKALEASLTKAHPPGAKRTAATKKKAAKK